MFSIQIQNFKNHKLKLPTQITNSNHQLKSQTQITNSNHKLLIFNNMVLSSLVIFLQPIAYLPISIISQSDEILHNQVAI